MHPGSSGKPSKIDRYFDFLMRQRYRILIIAAVLLVGSTFLAKKLYLKTNLSELLPQKLESVRDANEATARLGGTGLLVVGVQSPHYSKNRKFVEDLAVKIQPLVGKQLRYFEYRYVDVQDFLHKYALHYLDNNQLEKFNVRLKEEIEKKKAAGVNSLLGLDDDDAKQPEKKTESKKDAFDDIDPAFKRFLEYRDAYLSANDGKIMVLSLRPLATSLGINKTRALRDEVRGFINELDPKKYDPEMRVELSGNVQQALEEFDTIKADLFDTTIELVVMIVGIIFIFVWSIPVIVMLCGCLGVAVIYTFAITQLGIGYLNTQTAFLASLVVGTGINYGIIYLGRYKDLHRSLGTQEALRGAMKGTITPTLIGSSSTAVAFLCLLVSDNQGLSQFGFIGCVGVALCWIVTYSLVPIVVHEYESFGFKLYPWRNPLAPWAARVGNAMANFAAYQWRTTLFVAALITAVAAWGFLHLWHDPIEYNFDNVRTKLVLDPDYLAFRKRTHSVFPTSLNPSIIFADSEKEAREICPTIRSIKKALPAEKDVIQGCTSLFDMLPNTIPLTPGRVALMKETQSNLMNGLLTHSDHGEELHALGENMSFKPPTEPEIPPQMVQRFRELDGRTGLFAFVSPMAEKPINDGRNLLNFTNSLSDFKLPETGKVVSAAGDSFILADILRGITHDATVISALAFISVIIHCIIFAGGVRNGIFMGIVLAIASFWMVGFQGWIDMKYNFFNFIALPLTFGIGIDYPVNIFMPIVEDGRKVYRGVFTTSGAAVMLCSLTTFVGYLVLLRAKSQALATFAHIAVIGEFSCMIAALFIVPALLQLFSKGKALE